MFVVILLRELEIGDWRLEQFSRENCSVLRNPTAFSKLEILNIGKVEEFSKARQIFLKICQSYKFN